MPIIVNIGPSGSGSATKGGYRTEWVLVGVLSLMFRGAAAMEMVLKL